MDTSTPLLLYSPFANGNDNISSQVTADCIQELLFKDGASKNWYKQTLIHQNVGLNGSGLSHTKTYS